MKRFGILLLALLALAAVSGVASAAVVRGEGHYTYFGLAADTKPVSAQAGDRFIETDRQGREYVYTGSAWVRTPQSVTSDGAGAGERAEDSETGTDYLSVSEECKTSAIIDLATDASTTVYNGPAILNWAYLSVTIGTEAATIDDNTTAKLNLPVSLAVGVHPFTGARFDTSLVVNPGTNSTGTLTLCYRPLDSSQVTY